MLKIFVLLPLINYRIDAETICFCTNLSIENKDKFKSLPLIEMNKDKLVRIIEKDLEELRILTEEVNELKTASVLVIDLALGRARLICQEFELLRKVAVQTDPANEETEEETGEAYPEVDSDDSDAGFPDPEFEIVDFSTHQSEAPDEAETEIQHPLADEQEQEVEAELPEPEHEAYRAGEDENDTDEPDYAEPELEIATSDEQSGDENDELAEEEIIVYNADEDEDEDEEEEEDDFNEDEDLDEDQDRAVDEDGELDDDLIELDELDELDEEPDEEEEEEEEAAEADQKQEIQAFELKQEPPKAVREIHLEDLDDEDDEPIQFAPRAAATARPVMHEIPKPEEPVQEKLVVGEKFGTERSVNDVMSENKSAETNIGNGPISSLRAAIGLNDRFLFIREIFGNNTDKYNMVIEQLDRLETIQQAVDYLKANITLQKNNTSMKFVDLLKRRFSK